MPDNPATVVYVSNAASKEIFVFAMDRDSGALTPIERAAVPGTDKPSPTSMPLAISPGHRFLYAALRSPPFPVSSFAIDRSSGRLSHLGTAPLPDSMAYIVTDRSGRFLLGASYPGAKLAINPIDADGRVDGRPTQLLSTRPKAHCVVVDGSNRYVYCTSLGGDLIMQLRFDPALGTVSPNTPAAIATRAGAGPRHLAFHPNGRLLYLLNETDATLCAYAVDAADGTLAELQTALASLPPDFVGKSCATNSWPPSACRDARSPASSACRRTASPKLSQACAGSRRRPPSSWPSGLARRPSSGSICRRRMSWRRHDGTGIGRRKGRGSRGVAAPIGTA